MPSGTSRHCLIEAESQYTVIELELLAVTWSQDYYGNATYVFFTGFLYLEVITDHNHVISILNSHRMDEIESLQLQCLCMKVMAINFKAVWSKGNTNQAPDALSHNPIDVPGQQELLAESDKGDYQELSMAD